MKKILSLLIFILILITLGCQTVSNVPSAVTGASVNQDEAAISSFFSKLETAWNAQDAPTYLGMWSDGGVLVTHRGRSHKIFRNDVSATLSRMKEEGENQYRLQKCTVSSSGNTARATVKFSCPKGRLTMLYKMVSQNGSWLIKEQRAK